MKPAILCLVCTALLGVTGPLAAQPAQRPATMIDALARATGQGWQTVTLADGRRMALHRTARGTSFALGCRGDGVLVVAGGPARIARLESEEDEQIIPIAPDRVALRGARSLVEVLRTPDNPAGHALFLDDEAVAIEQSAAQVRPMAEDCAARLARSRPPEADTVAIPLWSGADGVIYLGVQGEGRPELRLTCDPGNRRLSIRLAGAPPNARPGQQATIVVATPTGRYSYRGRVVRDPSGPVDQFTEAQVNNASVLLNALSTEDGFATGFGETIDMPRPAQGLAGLIERRMPACR